MKTQSVCVLGNGQLGRMLKQAGEPLGIKVYPVGLDADPATIPYQQSVITAEIERWSDTPFTQILAKHPHFINRDVFPLIADRLTQKQLFDELGLPTAKWFTLNHSQDWPTLFTDLGDLLIVKRRTGGYDGRGQWRIAVSHPITVPDDIYQNAIVEQAIPFEKEMSLVGARNAKGETVFYPLTNNLHQDGILKMSVVLPNQVPLLQTQAEKMLSAIMHKLNYIGVMAMECFIVDGKLLINELAPRVHNSGHWTQNGASISQFELHLRAILDLPLPKPNVFAPSIMVNLIGTELNLNWLSIDLVHMHWYEKEVRAGRKVGHLNLTHSQSSQLLKALENLMPLLPNDYQKSIEWAKQKL
ncbi:5-(carboxyamino)imidazole ribonucleotide synthase [Gilliamella bombicola]|uniref:N5-carboxyaminoimidazole ribonucleotide synthase n=1 Tax=Gilliamella bombicola TaxID=1798182 RepID=A0A1C4AQI9_9GAMM|nr:MULTISPECIES: 5-(carboxyamino)imidazole ribonucleotide synthase [Gilliamella]NUF26601.1 5-(carboxyamino)imidazole ribonucleotide synthase [Gilliamella sp. ESL0254]SCB96738.1 5-(carboxyamino)imidazole ribonucleotide synthase [Gilliamella bombicola]